MIRRLTPTAEIGKLMISRTDELGDVILTLPLARAIAQKARFKLELELNDQDVDDEVVLLEAASEDILRRTHRRYFEDLQDLASPSPPPPESELVHSS